MLEERTHFVKMAGPEVFKAAVRSMCEAAENALRRAGVTAEEIDLLVPHQANNRIIEATARYAGDPDGEGVRQRGPLRQHELGLAPGGAGRGASSRAVPRPGDLVLMVAFGAGFTWAANVVRL